MKYPENRKNYLKTYYSRNKEKSLKQSKKWRENNPEQFKEYHYNYYFAHKDSEKMRTYMHLYYLKNKERIINRTKEWRKNNSESVKEIVRRYRETHKIESNNCKVLSFNRKILSLKELFLQDYGANLEKKDRNYEEGNRVFCLDCADRGKNCGGFKSCEYRSEVLEVIKGK